MLETRSSTGSAALAGESVTASSYRNSPAEHHQDDQLTSKSRGCLAVGLVVLVLGLAGCSSDEQPVIKTTSTRAAPTVTMSAPQWSDAYSPAEMAAYNEALATFNTYVSQSKPFWDAGKASPAAKKTLQAYTLPWEYFWDQLKQFERAGLKQSGTPRILDVRASRIKLSKSGASVTLRRCVDYTGTQPTQNGKPLSRPYDSPQLSDVVLSKTGGRWYVTPTKSSAEDQPCAG
jgi:hypothetical protein